MEIQQTEVRFEPDFKSPLDGEVRGAEQPCSHLKNKIKIAAAAASLTASSPTE